MIKSRTVIIVGAGASREVNLPMGAELKKQISEKLDIRFENWDQISGDAVLFESLKKFAIDKNTESEDAPFYQMTCMSIAESLPLSISIDNYLDAHRGNKAVELCGKLGIVAAILEAERNSLLFVPDEARGSGLNWASIQDTWYMSLQQLLTENVSRDETDKIFENITFIIFNYDRCIEHFLMHSLSTYYRIQSADAYNILSKAKIFHPYGVVGKLPWQDAKGISFGEKTNRVNLLEISNQIKTFTERVDEGSELESIKFEIENANKLVFLGFSYGETNLRLLRPRQRTEPLQILGTAFGISDDDVTIITNDISTLLQGDRDLILSRTKIRNYYKCNQFFNAFWRSIPT